MSAPRIYWDRAKNYRNWWKFDEVLTETNLLSFFWDTVYCIFSGSAEAQVRCGGKL